MRLLFSFTTFVFYSHIYSIIHLASPRAVFEFWGRADLASPWFRIWNGMHLVL